VSNFLKQFKRNNNFNKTSSNKGQKNEKFNPSMVYMQKAAKNFTNFTTCNYAINDSSSAMSSYMKTYGELQNCSVSVAAACNRSTPSNYANMKECNETYSKIKKMNEDCRDKTTKAGANATEACECWANMKTTYMDPMKVKKCNKEMSAMVKSMRDDKERCTDAFIACKKMEAKLPGLVYECMDFDVNEAWNPSNDTSKVSGVVKETST